MWCLHGGALVVSSAVKECSAEHEICQRARHKLWAAHYTIKDGFNNKEFMILCNKTAKRWGSSRVGPFSTASWRTRSLPSSVCWLTSSGWSPRGYKMPAIVPVITFFHKNDPKAEDEDVPLSMSSVMGRKVS